MTRISHFSKALLFVSTFAVVSAMWVFAADESVADKEVASTNLTNQTSGALPDSVVLERDVLYRTDKSKSCAVDVYYPKEKAKAPRPAVLFVHGGAWRGGDKYSNVWKEYPAEFAKDGFVAVSVGYR